MADQVLTQPGGAVQQVVALDHRDDRETGDRRHRVAAERAAVTARPEQLRGPPDRQAGADREAVAQTLGQRDDVGPDALARRAPASCRCDPCRSAPRRSRAGHRARRRSRGPGPGSRSAGRRCRSRPGSAPAPRPRSRRRPPRRARRRHRTGRRRPRPGSGANGSRYLGLWVIANAPIDRPWKAPSRRDDLGTTGGPGDLERGLVGLGAGVGEEDLRLLRVPPPSRSAARPARPGPGW